jgi:Ni/Co efflux regulator RcnB
MTKHLKSLAFGIAALAIGTSTSAFAQPARQEARQEVRQDAREARQDIREAQRDLQRARTPRQEREARRDLREAQRDLHQARNDRQQVGRYDNARGNDFRRGRPLPPGLRGRHYVVNDWHHHRLPAPQRGHQWVQVGPDYVLVGVATGIIANLVLAR